MLCSRALVVLHKNSTTAYLRAMSLGQCLEEIEVDVASQFPCAEAHKNQRSLSGESGSAGFVRSSGLSNMNCFGFVQSISQGVFSR